MFTAEVIFRSSTPGGTISGQARAMSISLLHQSLYQKHIAGNNGMGVPKVLIQAAPPISVVEFAGALLSSWRSADGRRSNLLGTQADSGVTEHALLCNID
jgi:hypothetical protein